MTTGTRVIPLTQGKIAIVDDADYKWLSKHKWHAVRSRRTWYAVRCTPRLNGKQTFVKMHRAILNAPDGMEVDHKNGDGLLNTRENLRLVTATQNKWNSPARANNRSGFKGVSWHKQAQKWLAQIQVNGKKIYLGCFATSEEAAAKSYRGEYAKLNFSEETQNDE